MSLLGVPSEIIALVLDSCDSVHDALALVSTCKHLYREWIEHGPKVVWSIWKEKMIAVDEALIAVRATQIVMDHEARNEQPPTDLNLSALSADHRKPSLPELSAVHTLSRVVGMMCAQATSWVSYAPNDLKNGQELPEYLPQCHNRVIKSMYRALIAAAALSGTYNEPAFHAQPAITPHNFATGEKKRLARFAAYQNSARPRDEQRMFANFAAWLRGNILTEKARAMMTDLYDGRRGRGLCCEGRVAGVRNDDIVNADGSTGKEDGESEDDISEDERDLFGDEDGDPEGEDDGSDDDDEDCPIEDLDGLLHSDTHLLVWETMQMLWAAEALRGCCFTEEYYLRAPADGTPFQTVHIVPFGIFRSVSVLLWKSDSGALTFAPARAPTTTPTDPVSQFRKERLWAATESGWDEVLVWMHERSGQRNHYQKTDTPTTPLRLKLFPFLFRHYANAWLGLRFFQTDWAQQWNDLRTLTDSYMLFTSDEPENRNPCSWDLVDGDFTDGVVSLETLRGKPEPVTYYMSI